MMRKALQVLALMGAALFAAPVFAQEAGGDSAPPAANAAQASELAQLRAEVAAQRASLDDQIRALQAQQAQLASLEQRLAAALGEEAAERANAEPVLIASLEEEPQSAQQSTPQTQPQAQPETQRVASASGTRGEQNEPQGAVGVAPEDQDRQPEVAVLGRQGSAITQKGKLSGEVEWSYARADRNRALFRGVEVVESVLIGVFDINENRQDVLTQKVGLQYGLTSDLEVGIDVPMIARWNTSVLTPVAGPGENGETREVDNSANGYGLGDIEFSLRKQLHAPEGFGAYVIGNLQVTAPTGKGPFEVPRNQFGEAQEAATGSGFWSVSPGLTAILPSDPGVVFGSVSYTKNFATDVTASLPPVQIERVDPGDSVSFSAGVGLALNPRLSLNFGYAHSWGFGTETTTRALVENAEAVTQTSRDLQVGRFLFGGTYKVDKRTSVNFGLEAGLTDDATDMRMVLRIPFVL